jgi:trypsin
MTSHRQGEVGRRPATWGLFALLLAAALLILPATAAAIIHGQDSSTDRYPWMAQVDVDGGLCGGSLVAPDWVLTAAHCTYGGSNETELAPGKLEVVLRRTKRSKRAAGEHFRVTSIVRHPSYDPNQLSDDVALLHLDHDASATPARLARHVDRSRWHVGSEVAGLGWGMTRPASPNIKLAADVLQRGRLVVGSDATCKQMIDRSHYWREWFQGGKPLYDPATMMCAGQARGGADTCFGDSGGPVFLDDPTGPLLLGVVSWGEYQCRATKRPSVQARVGEGVLNRWLLLELGTPDPPYALRALRLTPEGLGPVKIGMTAEEAATATAKPFNEGETSEYGCSEIVPGEALPGLQLGTADFSHRLTIIFDYERGTATDHGIRVGDTERKLKNAYGPELKADRVRNELFISDRRYDVTKKVGDKVYALRFYVYKSKVIYINAGEKSVVDNWSECA